MRDWKIRGWTALSMAATRTCFSESECVEHSSILFCPHVLHHIFSRLENIFYGRRKFVLVSYFQFGCDLMWAVSLCGDDFIAFSHRIFRFSNLDSSFASHKFVLCAECALMCVCELCWALCSQRRFFLHKKNVFLHFSSILCSAQLTIDDENDVVD